MSASAVKTVLSMALSLVWRLRNSLTYFAIGLPYSPFEKGARGDLESLAEKNSPKSPFVEG
jgi:hypothetical protein